MDFSIFISEYDKAKDKETYCLKHITNQYLPYINKLSIAQGIAKSCTHFELDGKTVYRKNTPTQYFLTVLKLIENYTDIDITEDLTVQIYDALMKNGSMSTLLSSIPESEITEFRTLVDMCVSDIYDNERDLTSFLETKFDALGMSLDTMLSSLNETISQLQNNNIDDVIKDHTNNKIK